MRDVENEYKCLPFWSWNDELDEKELIKQIEWMHENGVGGFFMHARGGLQTEYLGEKWFSCIEACAKKAQELGMQAYAYDENGWPSGFVGGKLLENIQNHDKYLTYTVGEFDKDALVSYDMEDESLRRVKNGKNCLNIFEHYTASTADVLNPAVVEQFLSLTHEEYKKRDTYGLKGFFTDEPQYFRWGVSYTDMIGKYFQEKYGEDVLDELGHLFVEKKGYRAFRYKYWKGMQSLLLDNFVKKIYTWCDKNGYKLTGHFIEERDLAMQMMCCGGMMPFYEYEHIPGVDFLARLTPPILSPRQVGSVAAQLGKKQVLTEIYASCGWDVTPQELKTLAEAQYVGGVNLMCQHLLPYTEHGQRKRDYPAHFSAVNPWVDKNFKEFNDYFSALGKILANSKEVVNVGVFHPLRSAYLTYKHEVHSSSVKELDESLADLTQTLTNRQIPFHFLDETLLEKYGKVEEGRLVLGRCTYDFIVFPKTYTMDKTSNILLQEYVKQGGRVLLTDDKPSYLEGKEYDFSYLKTNVTWGEILGAQVYRASENETVRTAYRIDKNGRPFIYAVNVGDATTVKFDVGNGKAFLSYDVLKDEYDACSCLVPFDKGRSYLLYITDEGCLAKEEKKTITLGERYTVCGETENYLTIDNLQYSFDDVTYSERCNCMGAFQELLKSRHAGKLYLKYTFTAQILPRTCRLYAEDIHTLCVRINGERVESCGSAKHEKKLLKYDIAKHIKIGENEIVIEQEYYQSEQVYYALFGENVTESLRNCLVYDCTVEAVYLKGDFGVYGNFRKGENEDVLCADNFYLVERKKEITSLIKDGYPFFRGDISLKQTIWIEDTNCELLICGRFHLIDVKVNGEYAGRMMFSNRLDVSKYLKRGDNEIVLTLTVGNRNLLGPFHMPQEEWIGVGPNSFERFGTWENGKSELCLDRYAFVKTIL